MNHSVAEIKRFIYERELNKPDVLKIRGRSKVSKSWDGGRGCRDKEEDGESIVGDEGDAQGEHGVRRHRTTPGKVFLSVFTLRKLGKRSATLPPGAQTIPLKISASIKP